MNKNKRKVYDFWNNSSCGEKLYLKESEKQSYNNQANSRYELEGHMIFPFAKFSEYRGLKVLEIGVGLGADHQKFAESGSELYGIDLTERAVKHTSHRLLVFGLKSKITVGDAELLEFPDDFFDLVYSWGVLHHSPNTEKAISEVLRVLKPRGEAKIMIYHKWSIVGYMLWVRYALMSFKPWMKLENIYSLYLESPGTKAYSILAAKELFSNFNDIEISTPLGHGDLLESNVGQRHKGLSLLFMKFFLPDQRVLPPNHFFM